MESAPVVNFLFFGNDTSLFQIKCQAEKLVSFVNNFELRRFQRASFVLIEDNYNNGLKGGSIIIQFHHVIRFFILKNSEIRIQTARNYQRF